MKKRMQRRILFCVSGFLMHSKPSPVFFSVICLSQPHLSLSFPVGHMLQGSSHSRATSAARLYSAAKRRPASGQQQSQQRPPSSHGTASMLSSPTKGGGAENAGGSAAERSARARSEELEAEQYLDDVLHDASMGGGGGGGSGHVGIGTGVSAFHAVR